MQRYSIAYFTLALVLFCSAPLLHAQAKVYTNSDKMTFAYDMWIYYEQHKHNLTVAADAVPEDKFFVTPPGVTKALSTSEQTSIGAEVAHAADAQERMCLLISTGHEKEGKMIGQIAMDAQPRTKAGVMAALAKSFEVCDPLIAAFKDSQIADMVMSQHDLKPLGTTLFNTSSHIREVNGRILSYMAVLGIKQPQGIEAIDPKNPKGIRPK